MVGVVDVHLVAARKGIASRAAGQVFCHRLVSAFSKVRLCFLSLVPSLLSKKYVTSPAPLEVISALRVMEYGQVSFQVSGEAEPVTLVTAKLDCGFGTLIRA